MGRAAQNLSVEFARPLIAGPELRGRIPSLDGLRALSILLVVLSHARTTTGVSYEVRRWVSAIPANGPLGVSIFFVISGFLITYLLVTERESTGKIGLSNFYIRRALRILPAYFGFLLVLWVLRRIWGLYILNQHFAAAGFFALNYAPVRGCPPWIGHTWSLNVEEQFYLLWPLILVPLGRVRARTIAITIIVVAPLVRLACWSWLPPEHLFARRIPYMLHTRADTLMFGCLAALVYPSPRFQEVMQRLFRSKLHLVAFVFLFVIAPYLTTWREHVYLAVGGYTAEGICIAILLVWAVQHPTSRFGRFLNWWPIVHVGVISYSLYLWQQLFLLPQNQTWTGRFPANLLYALLAAEISYWVIERTFLSLRSHFTGRRRYEVPVAAGMPGGFSSAPSNGRTRSLPMLAPPRPAMRRPAASAGRMRLT